MLTRPRCRRRYRSYVRTIVQMDLFVRTYGRAGGPTVLFLHGGHLSGWSWQPVVERLQRYHCLVPDLPQYGRSHRQGPFDIELAADAVAKLIRSRASFGRAHVVGYSLGAQVGTQLLATRPELVDRVLLSGTVINTMPAVRLTQSALRLVARMTRFGWAAKRNRAARRSGVPTAMLADDREDLRLNSGAEFASIVAASAGFTRPSGLTAAHAPTLFVTGTHELPPMRHWAAELARAMPNGIDRIAMGMPHNWPLRHPDLFARTVDAWLSGTDLPPEISGAQ